MNAQEKEKNQPDRNKVKVEAQAEEKEKIEISKKELEELRQKAAKAQEYLDRIMRLQADFDNARKRIEREKAEFVNFANQEIIIRLLSILDDFERATEAAEEKKQDPEAFLKGVELIMAHFYEMLKEHGVEPINAKGKPFDPNMHDAMMQVETDKFPDGTVIQELQKGYLLSGRVIRTAKVKVSKGK